jgi:hypothetical protein
MTDEQIEMMIAVTAASRRMAARPLTGARSTARTATSTAIDQP